jgi:hypothetical protein
VKPHDVRGTYSMTMSETIGLRAREVPAMTARQRLIVALLLGANFMMSVDFSILNIALPAVGEAVGLSVDNLPWVSTAFSLRRRPLTAVRAARRSLWPTPHLSHRLMSPYVRVAPWWHFGRLCSSLPGRYRGWRVQ